MLHTNQFSYQPHTRTFISDVSDLGPQVFERIYDDACDVGVQLVSAKTGKVIPFLMNDEVRDFDNDILRWNFVVEPTYARRNPSIADLKVVIFND